MIRVVAQFGSALDWGSRGRRFESCPPDQQKTRSAGFLAGLFIMLRDSCRSNAARNPLTMQLGDARMSFIRREVTLTSHPQNRAQGVMLVIDALPRLSHAR